MAGAAASPSRCKTMGVAGTGSSPLRPGDLTICYHAFYSSPACYDGPLDAMAACVVHAGGSDGGIQAHIKACAALGAICSSVVTAHNTIVVQGVSVTLKPWLPERIKATGTSEL
uniref:Uncharacterized protein n=1 Tax=Oryza glumipatula TaxID=40148 RepID=A0A0E0AQP1_9ORYZ